MAGKKSGRRQRRQRGSSAQAAPAVPAERRLHWFWLPSFFALAIAALSLTPRVQQTDVLTASFWAAALAIFGFQLALLARWPEARNDWSLLLSTPKKQHYLQALVQLSVYVYWGYYWRPVYDHALLMVGQLLFAYGFDILLSWWRRKDYVLGFGAFPIIFSTNLFLWFRDDWFYLQFVMIAVGFMGKEFIRWEREGRRVHIFNPSAYTLGLFSLLLLVTGSTNLTWGREIASTLTLAPNIYLFLFLTGLIVMYFFSITLVAGMAAIALFGLSAIYSSISGVPYFIDSEIPAAVFLGLHLLVTDPSTSPRSRTGKLIFGGLYGISVFVLYFVLGALGAPTFYDKLMAVPLLNLSVRWIDGLVTKIRNGPGWLDRPVQWKPARSNLAYMGVWIAFFGLMAALGKTDARHPGDSVPFWAEACAEGRTNGCERYLQITSSYCGDNSAWACNEVGRLYREGAVVETDEPLAESYFGRACELRFQAGCVNLLDESSTLTAIPKMLDLRLMLREGGANLLDMPESELLARACEHEWEFACGGDPSALSRPLVGSVRGS